ncbi:MAG: alpha-hydroxy-acid oxidizing protein [Gammaproteobacteria bacterium]|nr:alpha-hydroxy-acid oxidizing protein [Gammaproteobacteria bacterium]MDH3848089.1 alpha-hydroxy-acid oxidizing protein [Gammaproteobacteria bacterium]MDH3863209.1 alpha-hydroxy-acid oxidizing protein [Gammaproteobacteria bacterium]MDH3904978.1 alpha-hydroxy-acid oxidizing protein [Gammaproteobacteria bacterium]MDH3907856.1 alpha-hydroxy-acid oxidizing protein [Gammaproteobacteria bacterium]
MNIAKCNNVMDFRRVAKRRLPAPVFHYLDGGADDELTLARNTEAFGDYELLPSQLSDVSNVDLRSTIFGQEVDWPVMIAPTGASKLFHGAGEPAVARAAEKFGMVYSLSTLSTATIEDVAAATGGPKAFQLYIFKDRGLTDEWLNRCSEAGYSALQLTVDTPVAGNRERDFVYGFGAPPRSRLRQVASFARYPGWLYRALLRNDLEMVNITSGSEAARNWKGGIRKYIDEQLERSLTWKDVEWLAGRWPGALVIKGVQTVEDCRKAAESGATAVMLSNHGGRQLESAPAPVDCIAAVADALRDRLEIICDGGIRRGNHVVKALALGAHACSIGRGYLFALAAGGQAGVERALMLLRAEVERTMALAGCDSVRKLGRSHVRRRG